MLAFCFKISSVLDYSFSFSADLFSEGTYTNGTVTWQSVAPAHENEVDKKSFCSVMVFS